jgi:hypothetical protein
VLATFDRVSDYRGNARFDRVSDAYTALNEAGAYIKALCVCPTETVRYAIREACGPKKWKKARK